MTTVTLVYVPCPSMEVAQKLASMALEQNFAGCANIWPITSVYRWEGEIKRDNEIALLLKTVSSRIDSLITMLEQNHPYETPCIITSTGSSNTSYAHWLEKECSSSRQAP